MNGGQILCVPVVVLSAMLSEVSPLEDCPSPVQFVGHGCAVDFHTGRENDQVEPLADHREEEFDMGAQMDEKADRLVVDCDPEYEIRWRSWLHSGPEKAVMVRVDERLVQVKNHYFPTNNAKSLRCQRRVRDNVVSHWLMLSHIFVLFPG